METIEKILDVGCAKKKILVLEDEKEKLARKQKQLETRLEENRADLKKKLNNLYISLSNELAQYVFGDEHKVRLTDDHDSALYESLAYGYDLRFYPEFKIQLIDRKRSKMRLCMCWNLNYDKKKVIYETKFNPDEIKDEKQIEKFYEKFLRALNKYECEIYSPARSAVKFGDFMNLAD